MTLITSTNSEGSRKCDARCYNAKCSICTCICNGKNHGVGRRQAEANTRKYQEEIIEDWNGKHPDEKIVFEQQQGELF